MFTAHPTLDTAKRLTHCKDGASFYMRDGVVVAIVFPGESHSDAWQAAIAPRVTREPAEVAA